MGQDPRPVRHRVGTHLRRVSPGPGVRLQDSRHGGSSPSGGTALGPRLAVRTALGSQLAVGTTLPAILHSPCEGSLDRLAKFSLPTSAVRSIPPARSGGRGAGMSRVSVHVQTRAPQDAHEHDDEPGNTHHWANDLRGERHGDPDDEQGQTDEHTAHTNCRVCATPSRPAAR